MNKRVLITGAARGLGRATAIEFARHGYDLVLTYLTHKEEAIALKNAIEANYDVLVTTMKVDLSNNKEIDALIDSIDTLDCLVNNAAYNLDCDVFSKKEEDFIRILKINLVAPFLLAKGLFPKLKITHGNIINIASTNGINTMYPESLDYDASKAGLINITQNLASSFAPNVRVNAIAPGWIETEALSDMDPRFRKQEEEKCSLGRFAKPEEIAKTIYFVASSDASYMNGETVVIDGGSKYGCK